MRMKRLVAAIAVVTLLTVGTVSPAPAHAASTTEILVIAGAAIVGWVAFVVIATQIAYRKKVAWTEDPIDLSNSGKHPPKKIRFGLDCRPTSAETAPVACW